jgi:ubiquinone/menaquinone biosynthesis C-methylase UbiE
VRTAAVVVLTVAVAVLGQILADGSAGAAQSKEDKITCQIVYVPTPQAVVDKMLDMAKVTEKDTVYDLGCGDGRVVATAAKKYGAKGVGVDIDPERIKDSAATIEKLGVAKLVEIRQGDALKVKDLEKATVLMLYMLPEFMTKLEPIAKAKLAKGARIVAHDFEFPTWQPDQVVEFQGPEDRTHRLYMYTVK